MPDRCLAEWLTLLEARHPSEIDLGLDRVAAVWSEIIARRLDKKTPLVLPTAITVAGTNGKGSCIASMQAIMLQHGYRVGATTSPHFIAYNERISVQGQPVYDDLIVAAFAEIELARGQISLTYFEFGTLAALLIFADADLDIILLEVGLGGRLDAINIIDADVAVVTSIALDHQAWLGNTRELIAVEKLGIARAGRPLVIGESDSPQGFDQMIAETGAQALLVGVDFSIDLHEDQFAIEVLSIGERSVGELSVGELSTDGQPLEFVGLPVSGLLPINKTLAVQALICAGFDLDHNNVIHALNGLILTGRQQSLEFNGVKVVLDVAHNPAAAVALAKNLPPIAGRYIAVASVLSDKDWSGIVEPLSEIIDQWRIAEISDTDRATKGQTLLEVLYNAGLSGTLHETLEEAFITAHYEATADDTVVVFGSFYSVSAVLYLHDELQQQSKQNIDGTVQ
jgi:dihydrofolate synthase/folylpolyglutamate synthase